MYLGGKAFSETHQRMAGMNGQSSTHLPSCVLYGCLQACRVLVSFVLFRCSSIDWGVNRRLLL